MSTYIYILAYHIYIYICMHICISYTYMYVHYIYICMYACMQIVYTHMYIAYIYISHIYIYIHTHIYIYTYIHIYMYMYMLADRLPAHVLWMGWGGVGVGWGNNVRCNCFVTDLLRHFYLRCNCFVTVLLRHFYLRCNCFVTVLLRHFYCTCFVTTWGWGWGGVGWGNNVRCNCFVTDLLRHFYLLSQTQSCGSTSKFNSGAGRWEHASSSQRLDVSSQCCEKDVISIRILFEHKTL